MLGIIMAGGKGTRLFPLTENKPKPLVEILGIPVIDYVKDALIKASVEEIVVTTGFHGGSLKKLVSSWDNDSDIECSVNQETQPMGTAGSVKLLHERLTQTFIVASGDAVLSSELNLLIDAHKSSGAKVTMALWEVEDPTEFGIVGLSKQHQGELNSNLNEGYIVKFLEKPTKEQAFSTVINAGLYIIEPEVMDYVPHGEKYDFSKQLFPNLLESGIPLYAVKLNGAWFDVGTPEELIKAQNYLLRNSDSLPFDLPEGTLSSDHGFLFKSATTQSSLVDSVVCNYSHVGSNSQIKESLVMKQSVIGNDCEIMNTIIGENVTVGNRCILINCVVGDGVKIPDNSKIRYERISLSTNNHTQ